MSELPGFDEVWRSFARGQVGSVLKNNPLMEELCKVIFATAVTEVVRASTRVPLDMKAVFMLKLASTSAEAGMKSVDRLLDLMSKTGAGSVSVDLHGVFVPGGFKV